LQYNSFKDWGWLEDLPSISQIEVSHRRTSGIRFVPRRTRTSTSLHWPRSFRSRIRIALPTAIVDTNVKGTLHLLSAAKISVGARSSSHVHPRGVGTAQDRGRSKSATRSRPRYRQTHSKNRRRCQALSFTIRFNFGGGRPSFQYVRPRQVGAGTSSRTHFEIASRPDEIRVGDLAPTAGSTS